MQLPFPPDWPVKVTAAQTFSYSLWLLKIKWLDNDRLSQGSSHKLGWTKLLKDNCCIVVAVLSLPIFLPL